MDALSSIWEHFVIPSGRSDLVITGFFTFMVHEIAYFGAYIPFLIIDHFPYFHQWKIQKSKENTFSLQWKCIKGLILAHVLLEAPMVLTSVPIFQYMGLKYTLPLPSFGTMLYQIVVFFFIEDFMFYWGHRLLHTEWLYKNIHSIHHTYSAPFGIAAEYAHPIETMFLGLATMMGPALYGPHLLTLWIYLVLRSFQTVECHSGYDLPISPNRWLPFYGGAEHHDLHHQRHSGNYASSFKIWDYIFGTDKMYRAMHEKLARGEKVPR